MVDHWFHWKRVSIFIWLVVSTPLKNISQLGLLFPIYGKIKNVPSHKPIMYVYQLWGFAKFSFGLRWSKKSWWIFAPLRWTEPTKLRLEPPRYGNLFHRKNMMRRLEFGVSQICLVGLCFQIRFIFHRSWNDDSKQLIFWGWVGFTAKQMVLEVDVPDKNHHVCSISGMHDACVMKNTP